MGPQYAALFPGRYSREEIYFEPFEALASDHVMLWKASYFVDKFENDVGVREHFEKVFEDDSVNVIWRRKTAKQTAVNWKSVFYSCREGKQ